MRPQIIAIAIATLLLGLPGALEAEDLYVAQVSAHRTMDAARAGLDRLRQQFPDVFQNAKPHIHEVDLASKGVWYRLQIGPPASRADIEAICASLRAGGHPDCMIKTAFEVGLTKPGHKGELALKPVEDGENMTVLELIEFVDAQGRRWTVPAGVRTDGASIPRPLWSIVGSPFTGKYLRAAVIHDEYVRNKKRSWMDTHDVFYEAMIASGVDKSQAMLMWAAVYRFGPRWARNESVCWGTCACSEVIIEKLDLFPEFTTDAMQKLRSLIDDRLDREQLKERFEVLFDHEAKAQMVGYINDQDCDKGDPFRKGVRMVAPPNWYNFGLQRRTIPDSIYRVVKVKPGDLLKLRPSPNTTEQPSLEIPYNATGLKVVGECGEWCRVLYKGTIGWVGGAYIAIDRDASKIIDNRQ